MIRPRTLWPLSRSQMSKLAAVPPVRRISVLIQVAHPPKVSPQETASEEEGGRRGGGQVMNEPHDPKVTADLPAPPADSLGAADPSATIGQVRGLAGTDGSHTAADAPASDLAAVPGYHVLRAIARGGMGRVLAAHDLSLDREVALKLLLPGAPADRFVREAKITARLPHPGIPPVHALGTLADGSPFLAMKLIAGQTLAEEMKTADRPRLLQAFTQVCQAVGFAHSRGVIHRDLKPTNVMVGAFGEVQVMDWGLAKDLGERCGVSPPVSVEQHSSAAPAVAMAGTDPNQTTDQRAPGESTDDQTQAGQVLGTPAYMAPEQARGEATDARADVFALGGILCAILTGQPLYRGKFRLEVLRRAAAADLGEAHARLDGCGADPELVALCRRCLSPNPVDRPAHGQAVADGLTAYQNGVQERLRQAELAEAAAKTKTAEEAKGRRLRLALAGTVLVAVLGGVVGTSIYLMQAQKAESDAALRAAADHARLGRNAEAVSGLLDQTMEALQAGDAAKAKVLLEAAGKRAAEGGADDLSGRSDRLQADLAVLNDLDKVDQLRWTWVENKFPDPAAVAAQVREALMRFGLTPESVSAEEASARVSGSAVRDRVVTALDRWMWVEKLPWLRAVLRAADPDAYRDAVRDAVLARDGVKMTDLAGRAQAAEQPPGFVAFFGEIAPIPVERRRELLKRAVRHRPGDLGLLMALGDTFAIKQKDDAEKRLRWYQAAVGVAPRNGAAHTNLGGALIFTGRVDEAIACWRKAIKLDPKLAKAHSNLGVALYGKGQLDEAIASYRKAIELDPKLAKAHYNLGVALTDKGKVDAAIACYRKAIELDPKLANTHNDLGVALHGKGKVDETIACWRKAIELDPKLANVHCCLGAALANKGQLNESITSYRKAIQIEPRLAEAHNNLGNALKAKGQWDEAIASYRKAIELDPKLALAYNGLGAILCDGKRDYDAAIASFRKAIALDPKVPDYHDNLGNALQGKGQWDEAIASYRKAIALDPQLAMAHHYLGNALGQKGQWDEAIACWRKAIELDPKHAEAHCNLGHALRSQGLFAESLAALQRAHELGTKQSGWPYPSAVWVREAERLATLEGKLPALLRGEFQPKDAAERLILVRVCQAKKLHAAAARLSAHAFAADPKLADDLQAQHRYSASCHAALAAAGQGEDAGKLDDKEKVRLRKQTLDWLRADLALYTKRIESGPPAARTSVQQTLKHWHQDSDLAGIRDAAALAKLPAQERTDCQQLWADVAALLQKAEGRAK